MAISSNTTPLIALAKIGKLTLLKQLYGTVVIPPFVKIECIDRGKAIGAADAYEIEKASQEGWISVAQLERTWKTRANNLMQRAPIGPGEAEAIILAQAKRMPVILDDADARAIARSLKVHHFGTVMVPYEAFIKRLVAYEELVTILTDVSRVLWVSPVVIAEIIRRAQGART